MDYNTKNYKTFKKVPEFKGRLKKQLIPHNCVSCRF